MKGDYQKPLRKLTLFFISNPVPFNGQSYQKQKEPRTSDQSVTSQSSLQVTKQVHNNFFISYILSDQV